MRKQLHTPLSFKKKKKKKKKKKTGQMQSSIIIRIIQGEDFQPDCKGCTQHTPPPPSTADRVTDNLHNYDFN